MKTLKRAIVPAFGMAEKIMRKKVMHGMQRFLFVGLLGSTLVLAIGCNALDPRRMCEKELTETRAKLDQTSQLASRLSEQLKAQQAELRDLKQHNVEDVRREKEQALAQIEIKRQELEQERFEINRMRILEQAQREY
jgi:septal ring factor EnvC (AmiA/AmiB activator)